MLLQSIYQFLLQLNYVSDLLVSWKKHKIARINFTTNTLFLDMFLGHAWHVILLLDYITLLE